MCDPNVGPAEPTENEVALALAAIIGNTKRVRRRLSLLEVAHHIAVASAGLGGLRRVADRVGLSEQMLRDFLSVNRLTPAVQELVRSRAIDGVDAAARLARLPEKDQMAIAEAVATERLDGMGDLRAVLSLRKAVPSASTAQLVERVEESRDIREYLAEFITQDAASDVSAMQARVAEVIGEENIRHINVADETGVLAMNAKGRKRLQGFARERGLTKREVIDRLVRGEKV